MNEDKIIGRTNILLMGSDTMHPRTARELAIQELKEEEDSK